MNLSYSLWQIYLQRAAMISTLSSNTNNFESIQSDYLDGTMESGGNQTTIDWNSQHSSTTSSSSTSSNQSIIPHHHLNNLHSLSSSSNIQLQSNSSPSSTPSTPKFVVDMTASEHLTTPNGTSIAQVVGSHPQYTVEYLSHLLKDKKQLAAFPNVFHHLERLVDEEISKVRVALFQFEFSKDNVALPDAEGEITVHTEKVYVPAKEHPDSDKKMNPGNQGKGNAEQSAQKSCFDSTGKEPCVQTDVGAESGELMEHDATGDASTQQPEISGSSAEFHSANDIDFSQRNSTISMTSGEYFDAQENSMSHEQFSAGYHARIDDENLDLDVIFYFRELLEQVPGIEDGIPSENRVELDNEVGNPPENSTISGSGCDSEMIKVGDPLENPQNSAEVPAENIEMELGYGYIGGDQITETGLTGNAAGPAEMEIDAEIGDAEMNAENAEMEAEIQMEIGELEGIVNETEDPSVDLAEVHNVVKDMLDEIEAKEEEEEEARKSAKITVLHAFFDSLLVPTGNSAGPNRQSDILANSAAGTLDSENVENVQEDGVDNVQYSEENGQNDVAIGQEDAQEIVEGGTGEEDVQAKRAEFYRKIMATSIDFVLDTSGDEDEAGPSRSGGNNQPDSSDSESSSSDSDSSDPGPPMSPNFRNFDGIAIDTYIDPRSVLDDRHQYHMIAINLNMFTNYQVKKVGNQCVFYGKLSDDTISIRNNGNCHLEMFGRCVFEENRQEAGGAQVEERVNQGAGEAINWGDDDDEEEGEFEDFDGLMAEADMIDAENAMQLEADYLEQERGDEMEMEVDAMRAEEDGYVKEMLKAAAEFERRMEDEAEYEGDDEEEEDESDDDGGSDSDDDSDAQGPGMGDEAGDRRLDDDDEAESDDSGDSDGDNDDPDVRPPANIDIEMDEPIDGVRDEVGAVDDGDLRDDAGADVVDEEEEDAGEEDDDDDGDLGDNDGADVGDEDEEVRGGDDVEMEDVEEDEEDDDVQPVVPPPNPAPIRPAAIRPYVRGYPRGHRFRPDRQQVAQPRQTAKRRADNRNPPPPSIDMDEAEFAAHSAADVYEQLIELQDVLLSTDYGLWHDEYTTRLFRLIGIFRRATAIPSGLRLQLLLGDTIALKADMGI